MAKHGKGDEPPATEKTGGLRTPAARALLGASGAVAGGLLAIIWVLRRWRGEQG